MTFRAVRRGGGAGTAHSAAAFMAFRMALRFMAAFMAFAFMAFAFMAFFMAFFAIAIAFFMAIAFIAFLMAAMAARGECDKGVGGGGFHCKA